MPPPKKLSHLRVAHTGEALATRLRTSRSSLVLDDERDSLGDTGTPAAIEPDTPRSHNAAHTHESRTRRCARAARRRLFGPAAPVAPLSGHCLSSLSLILRHTPWLPIALLHAAREPSGGAAGGRAVAAREADLPALRLLRRQVRRHALASRPSASPL